MAPSPQRKIKVRKNNVTPISTDKDEEYHSPVCAQDSKWSGIIFKNQIDINVEHAQGSIEDECEIKLIDLESSSPLMPLFILFPDLRNERSLEHLSTGSKMSTSSLTKLLCGKTPKMELLQPSRKLKPTKTLEPVAELTDSDDSGFKRLKLERSLIRLPLANDTDSYLGDDDDEEHEVATTSKSIK